MAVPYDPRNPDFEDIRRIFFDWLRVQSGNIQLSSAGAEYEPYVEFIGNKDLATLAMHIFQVFWQCMIEGIVAPGIGPSSYSANLPWLHVTPYGRMILAQEAGHPHDPDRYIARLCERVSKADATVVAYVTESLNTFRRGAVVAAAVMLGIAAERVFLLVCESFEKALTLTQEKAKFAKILERFPMKPKLDWVHGKLRTLQSAKTPGFPENAALTVTAIYDLLRSQRNDLGHPRDLPPKLDREDVFANLQLFPRFYETAEQVRVYLGNHEV